ncbi:MAG: AI-2E family transporter [Patescibacteria group bacterium]
MANKETLDISWGTILKISLTVIGFFLLYQIADIAVLFVFALIISILASPSIDFLKKAGVPKSIAVVSVYMVFFGIISLFLYLAIPVFSEEVRAFSRLMPEYFEQVSPVLEGIGVQAFESVEGFLETVDQSSEMIATNIFNALAVIFGGMSTTLFVITMAIFLSLEDGAVEKAIRLIFTEKDKNQALVVWRKAKRQVTNWFFVRILACIFVGIASYIAFYLFNVEYAFLFALMAGLFNFIPYVGPVVAGGVFFVVILLDSAWKAFFALLAYGIIQTIEGSVVSPLLSKKYMGLSPVLVLIALVIGGTLWGFLGALLAIPLLGILFEFFKEFIERRKKRLTA